jgi:hypothetical protein
MLQETAFGTVPKTFQLIEKLLEDTFLTPVSEAENLVLSAFGLVLVLFWITNWPDNGFFNSLVRQRTAYFAFARRSSRLTNSATYSWRSADSKREPPETPLTASVPPLELTCATGRC